MVATAEAKRRARSSGVSVIDQRRTKRRYAVRRCDSVMRRGCARCLEISRLAAARGAESRQTRQRGVSYLRASSRQYGRERCRQ